MLSSIIIHASKTRDSSGDESQTPERGLVKQVQEASLFFVIGPVVIIAMVFVLMLVIRLFLLERRRGGTLLRRDRRDGTFDDLVKFAPIEPDAPARGAIINLNTLSLRHDQRYITDRTIHDSPP
jgi:Mg2+/citrate symporter